MASPRVDCQSRLIRLIVANVPDADARKALMVEVLNLEAAVREEERESYEYAAREMRTLGLPGKAG